MKLGGLIKIFLNKTYSSVHIGKSESNAFPIWNGLKQGVALSPLLFKFPSKYAIRNVQKISGSDLNETHQLLVCAYNLNILDKNTEALLQASREVGLEVYAYRTECMFMFHHQNAGKNNSLLIANKSFQKWQSSGIWE